MQLPDLHLFTLSFQSTFVRRAGSMASMSGADDMMYVEYSSKNKQRHPLFKKFRNQDRVDAMSAVRYSYLIYGIKRACILDFGEQLLRQHVMYYNQNYCPLIETRNLLVFSNVFSNMPPSQLLDRKEKDTKELLK